MLGCPQTVLQHLILVLDGHFLTLQLLDLLTLTLPGRLRCLTITEDPLDAPLLFLVFGFCAFAKVGISLYEHYNGVDRRPHTEGGGSSSASVVLDPMTFASSSASSPSRVPLSHQ